MSNITCPQCGAPLTAGVTECKYCGEIIPASAIPQQVQPQYQQPPQPQYQQPQYQQPYQQPYNPSYQPVNGVDPSWPVRNKVTAGLLAIFLGGLGIHKFYLSKPVAGILYLIFCWTYVPAILGLIEGIIYLTQSEADFQTKNKVRLQ